MEYTFRKLVVCLLLCLPYWSPAQKFDEAFFRENLKKNTYALDTEAEAIVLYEKGTYHINPIGVNDNYIYEIHKIIKILKNTSQQLGNVKHIYQNKNGKGYIRNIEATTYNMESNRIVESKLDKSNTYDKKLDRNYHEVAFAMPAVKEGSVIDIRFEAVSTYFSYNVSWDFQSAMPKLRSEYELIAPSNYQFTEASSGHLQFKKYGSISEADEEKAPAYKVVSQSANKSYSVVYGRRNLPALKEEPFISNIGNYKEMLDLQISGYDKDEINSSWKLLNEDLWDNADFGKRLSFSNAAEVKAVDSLTRNEDTELKKARSIFNYVRTNFDCLERDHVYAHHDFSEIYKNKKGNNAEINLLLTAMLRNAGIKASPVILSKQGEIRITEKYPLWDRFNHVISVATIDGTQYFMDATDKFNVFGVLPVYCYNGYAWIVDKVGAPVTLNNRAVTEKSVFKVNISRITDTSMSVVVSERWGFNGGRKLRHTFSKDTSLLTKYVHKRLEVLHDEIALSSLSVDNLDVPEKDLVIRYAYKIKKTSSDIIYLTSDFYRFFDSNPFTAPQRNLPIEFHCKYDETYKLDILLPENMMPEDLPKPQTVAVNDNELLFSHDITFDSSSRMLSVSARYKVNDTYFEASDYPKIKTFYDNMIQAQHATLTLKKNDKK